MTDRFKSGTEEEGVPGEGRAKGGITADSVTLLFVKCLVAGLPESVDRDALKAKLKEQSVPTIAYSPKLMHEQRAFEGMHLCLDGCPVTKRPCATMPSLPMGLYLGGKDVEAVTTALRGSL